MTVAPDPHIHGAVLGSAQVPTAFLASIQNLGPAADTYDLTFSNVPGGFTLLNSGDRRHDPRRADRARRRLPAAEPASRSRAGDEGLVHRHGHQHHQPALTQTQTETFTVPADRRPDDHEQPGRA